MPTGRLLKQGGVLDLGPGSHSPAQGLAMESAVTEGLGGLQCGRCVGTRFLREGGDVRV